jgi:hypothetical protein
VHPGVGAWFEGAIAVFTHSDLGFGPSDDGGEQEMLLGLGVLPEPQLVARHFGMVGFGEPMLQLLRHYGDGPGSGAVLG